MPALGCFLFLILPLGGLVLGGLVAGHDGMAWGAGAGLILAIGVLAISGSALIKAGKRR